MRVFALMLVANLVAILILVALVTTVGSVLWPRAAGTRTSGTD